MSKKDKLLLAGVALIAFGIFMFFKSTRIYSWGFYRIGNTVSTGGILIGLILLDVVFLVATRSKITKVLLPILVHRLASGSVSDAGPRGCRGGTRSPRDVFEEGIDLIVGPAG